MSSRLLIAILALTLSLGVSAPAVAVMCALDDVPAATLLLPYFETTAMAPGVNTLMSINNATAEAALAHVTFWTNWSMITYEFDLYLTGYDVATFSLRDVIFNGLIPITADQGTDPTDTISPQGPYSQDAAFPGCDDFFPFYVNPVIRNAELETLQKGHLGLPLASLGSGRCLSQGFNDGIARGYITVDSVSHCSTAVVLDPGYFVDGGSGIANNNNVFWGDYFIYEPRAGTAFGERLVAIEAHPEFNATSTSTGYTFYGRYYSPAIGGDNREPLGTAWAVRVLPGLGRSDLLVWRDSTANNHPANGFVCNQGPNWYPLNENEVFFFDEQENATELCNPPGLRQLHSPPLSPFDAACFPFETGRYQVDVGDLSVPANFGWLHLNLNLPPDSPAGDGDFGRFGLIAQSYTTESHTVGTLQAGLAALELSSACNDVDLSID